MGTDGKEIRALGGRTEGSISSSPPHLLSSLGKLIFSIFFLRHSTPSALPQHISGCEVCVRLSADEDFGPDWPEGVPDGTVTALAQAGIIYKMGMILGRISLSCFKDPMVKHMELSEKFLAYSRF